MLLKMLKSFPQMKLKRYSSNLSYFNKPGVEPLKSSTCGQLLAAAATKYPQRQAIVSCQQEKSLTYAELLMETDKFASGLKKLHLHKGDTIAIWAANSLEWVVSCLAAARLGVTLVQLNHSYKTNDILYSIRKSKPKVLICGHSVPKQNYYEILQQIDGGLFMKRKYNNGVILSEKLPSLRNVVSMDPDLKGTLHFQELLEKSTLQDIEDMKCHQSAIDMDDVLNIQFTSGSTGLPKATVLTHHKVVNNSFMIASRLKLHSKHHKICLPLPLFHTFGTTVGLFGALHYGSTVVLPNDFYDPKMNLKAIAEHECTLVYGTPTMFVDLIEEQKQQNYALKLDVVATGGAPTSSKLIDNIYNVLKCNNIVNMYGMTESTAVFCQSHLYATREQIVNTAGHFLEHIEAKVVNPNNALVPFGIPGELCIRGYSTMLRYLDDEDQSSKVLTPDGWLRTGDKCVMNEDGSVQVKGRIKEIIIRGGENIHPKEVEDCIIQHTKVADCQVVGLPHDRLGEEVCACVRTKENESLTLQEIIDFCKVHLSHYKVPSRLHVFDHFPKTTSGKVQKFRIVHMLKEIYHL